jgi:Holliday junction resolvase RusA-like endonuclease
MFTTSNETATEQNKRLAGVLRKSLITTLETTLTRVRQIPKELPVNFTVQCRALSTNQMSGRRKTFETKHYLEYRDLIARVAGGFYGISKKDRFICYVEVGYSNTRADVDNSLKPLLDSLTACIDEDFDDSQIYRIELDKVIVKKGQEYVKFLMEPLTIIDN